MLQTTWPFTRAQAHAAGISDHRLRNGEFRPLLTGVYVDARVPHHPELAVAAALLVHPDGAVATHFSAARVYRAPVPREPREHVTVQRAEDRRHRRGVRCHVAALAATEVRVVRRLRLSSPTRMFVELAAYLSLVDLVVVGDWLVRKELTTTTELVGYCRGSRLPHAAEARRAAEYVRPRVDSPMESRLRMLLVLAGLPEPEVNRVHRDENGVVVMRLDLSYPRVRVAVEYDGRHHVEVVGQWERDVDRREELGDDGWRHITVTRRGVYQEPQQTVERVWRALRDRGWRPLPRPTDGWRPYFG